MTETRYTDELKSIWETNVDTVLQEIKSNEFEKQTLQEGVKQLIDAAVEQSHSNWEKDTRCPECGSTTIFRWVSYPEIGHHKNGAIELRHGLNHSTTFAWECADCDTLLAVSPAAIVNHTLPGEIDWTQTQELTTLQQVLDNHRVNTDWKPGSPCSMCKANHIHELPIDVYSGVIQEPHFEQDHFGERITTMEYLCDKCGETLSQNTGSLFTPTLTLTI